MGAPSREQLEKTWRHIGRYDTHPVARLSVDDPEAYQKIRDSFNQYARGSTVWVDSETVIPRPLHVTDTSADYYITLHQPQLEFVVVRDSDPFGFRAITEEEYEWKLYAEAENDAQPSHQTGMFTRLRTHARASQSMRQTLGYID